MSTVTVEEIEALVSTGLGTPALQGVIDRDEDWLANDPKVGIGQLEGERTQRIWTRGHDDPLLLRRPVLVGDTGASLEVQVDGVIVDDVVLTGPARIERRDHAWGDYADVTYSPGDLSAVKRAIIELVRLSLTSSPYQSETTEGHTYSRPADVDAQRDRIARRLNPHRGYGTMQLGTGSSHRITTPQ